MTTPEDANSHKTGETETQPESPTGGIDLVETQIGDETAANTLEELDLGDRDPYGITREDLEDLPPEKRAQLQRVLDAGSDPLAEGDEPADDIEASPSETAKRSNEAYDRTEELLDNANYRTMQRMAGQLADVNGNAKKEELRAQLHDTNPELVKGAFEAIATDASGSGTSESSGSSQPERTDSVSDSTPQSTEEAKERYINGETDEQGLETDLEKTVPTDVEDDYDDSLVTGGEDQDDVGPYTDNDDGPDPGTLTETGLLDDDGDFPWEGETISETEVGDLQVLEFQYAGAPIEIREPADAQKLENARGIIEGAIASNDMGDAARERLLTRYFDRLADICLTIDGHPHKEVYVVTNPRTGKNQLVHEDTAAKYGQQLASMDNAMPFWKACTPFKRQQLGRRMDRFTTGEEQFQPR